MDYIIAQFAGCVKTLCDDLPIPTGLEGFRLELQQRSKWSQSNQTFITQKETRQSWLGRKMQDKVFPSNSQLIALISLTSYIVISFARRHQRVYVRDKRSDTFHWSPNGSVCLEQLLVAEEKQGNVPDTLSTCKGPSLGVLLLQKGHHCIQPCLSLHFLSLFLIPGPCTILLIKISRYLANCCSALIFFIVCCVMIVKTQEERQDVFFLGNKIYKHEVFIINDGGTR